MKTIARILLVGLMFVTGIGSLYAQGHRGGHRTIVHGKVTSVEGEVIDFATIYLKGTSYGATTNAEGRYALKAPAGEYTWWYQPLDIRPWSSA